MCVIIITTIIIIITIIILVISIVIIINIDAHQLSLSSLLFIVFTYVCTRA